VLFLEAVWCIADHPFSSCKLTSDPLDINTSNVSTNLKK
jgi:hypothetical protein